MKYLGQYIQNLKSRFRSSIYLERVADSGETAGKFLILDTDSKVGYRSLNTYGIDNKNADNSFKVGLIPGAAAGDPGGFKFLKADGVWASPLGYVAGTGISISGTSIALDIDDVIASDVANRVLTTDGDGTLSAETNMEFDGSALELGANADQNTLISFQNDENIGKIGVSNANNSLCVGDADGDFAIVSTGAHNIVFAANTGVVPTVLFKIENAGGCTITNNLTTGGIILDGNTITGVDDSEEFTNDDAHIMTSAAVEDKILGYNFLTSVPNHSGDLITSGTVAAARVATLNQDTTGNAATVTTNANLTGHITSTGNATVLGSFTIAQLSAAISNASISGNNTGDQTNVSGSAGTVTSIGSLTGDVTSSNRATTIANDAVTYAKMQNVTNATMLGNNAGSDGDVTEMTKANVLSFLNVADGATADQTNVTGSSGSCTGNAATATTLATTRALQVTLSETDSANFNGSAAVTDIGVTGTLAVGNGGTGATTFASNSLLTGNSTSAIQAEAELTYDSDTLLIGPDDLTSSYIKKRTHSDGGGGSLQIWAAEAGGANKSGGILAFYGGASTGTANGGNMRFYTCPSTADSDSDVNPHVLRMSIEADGSVDFKNNVVSDFHRKLTPTSTSTSGDADGDVVYFGSGPSGGSTTAGYIYFYKGTGNWELADADSTTLGGNGFLGVSIGTDPSADGMLVRGMVTHHVEIEGTEGKGAILYLSTTAGVATVDPPTSSGDLVRIIGYALDTDNDQMYFNPSMDWIEIA